MTPSKLVILGTGGTIAGLSSSATDNIGYTAAQVGVAQLVEAIPALLAGGAVVTEQVAQLDSKDMDFAVWAALASRINDFLAQTDVCGIVITHGTDTLEETAFFLQAVCQPAKPVVLTCAMRPASALTPDGPQNVLDAAAVARHPGAQGVVVVCAGTIHGAIDVQKAHTYRLNAFTPGDAGPVGYVEEGCVRQLRDWPAGSGSGDHLAAVASGTATSWPQVEIVMSHAGARGKVVDALVSSGVQGIVVAATGNGTVHHALEQALLRAQAAGVQVRRSTRCAEGHVLPRPDDAIPDSKGLSPVKARIALMLELMGWPGTR
ncbi:asparaginase [Polaromonas sp. YR568]|uniref:asparaginase n=1 Tax=Polaromonas sp. YR568 TaxID=1855301 RepID=UPI003137ACF0